MSNTICGNTTICSNDLIVGFTPEPGITLDLSTIGLPVGTHSIQMKLSDDGVTKRDSELSNAVSYTVSSGETWVIKERPILHNNSFTSNTNFTSNNESYTLFDYRYVFGTDSTSLYYGTTRVYYSVGYPPYWINEAYRTVTFETAPTGDLLTWLQANAVKQ